MTIFAFPKVAMLVADGTDEQQARVFLNALTDQRFEVQVIGLEEENLERGVQLMQGLEPVEFLPIHSLARDTEPGEFIGLVLPGGALGVEKLREDPFCRGLTRAIYEENLPVAAVGNANWILADAGILNGRTVTSRPAIQKDIERAGAVWKELPFVADRNLFTAAGLEGLDTLMRAFTAALREVNKAISAA